LRFFYCGGLMPKWKNRVEKSPVRNIIFVCNTKKWHFLQNKPVGSEIVQKCKNRKKWLFCNRNMNKSHSCDEAADVATRRNLNCH
jgi:hypothetical protein